MEASDGDVAQRPSRLSEAIVDDINAAGVAVLVPLLKGVEVLVVNQQGTGSYVYNLVVRTYRQIRQKYINKNLHHMEAEQIRRKNTTRALIEQEIHDAMEANAVEGSSLLVTDDDKSYVAGHQALATHFEVPYIWHFMASDTFQVRAEGKLARGNPLRDLAQWEHDVFFVKSLQDAQKQTEADNYSQSSRTLEELRTILDNLAASLTAVFEAKEEGFKSLIPNEGCSFLDSWDDCNLFSPRSLCTEFSDVWFCGVRVLRNGIELNFISKWFWRTDQSDKSTFANVKSINAMCQEDDQVRMSSLIAVLAEAGNGHYIAYARLAECLYRKKGALDFVGRYRCQFPENPSADITIDCDLPLPYHETLSGKWALPKRDFRSTDECREAMSMKSHAHGYKAGELDIETGYSLFNHSHSEILPPYYGAPPKVLTKTFPQFFDPKLNSNNLRGPTNLSKARNVKRQESRIEGNPERNSIRSAIINSPSEIISGGTGGSGSKKYSATTSLESGSSSTRASTSSGMDNVIPRRISFAKQVHFDEPFSDKDPETASPSTPTINELPSDGSRQSETSVDSFPSRGTPEGFQNDISRSSAQRGFSERLRALVFSATKRDQGVAGYERRLFKKLDYLDSSLWRDFYVGGQLVLIKEGRLLVFFKLDLKGYTLALEGGKMLLNVLGNGAGFGVRRKAVQYQDVAAQAVSGLRNDIIRSTVQLEDLGLPVLRHGGAIEATWKDHSQMILYAVYCLTLQTNPRTRFKWALKETRGRGIFEVAKPAEIGYELARRGSPQSASETAKHVIVQRMGRHSCVVFLHFDDLEEFPEVQTSEGQARGFLSVDSIVMDVPDLLRREYLEFNEIFYSLTDEDGESLYLG